MLAGLLREISRSAEGLLGSSTCPSSVQVGQTLCRSDEDSRVKAAPQRRPHCAELDRPRGARDLCSNAERRSSWRVSAKPSQLDPEGTRRSVTPGSITVPSVIHSPPLSHLAPGWRGLHHCPPALCHASPRLAFLILAHPLSAWISCPIFLSGRVPGLQFPEFFCVRECLPLACFSEDPWAEPDVFPSGLFQSLLCHLLIA